MKGTQDGTHGDADPRGACRERAKYLSGLIWHAGTFVIINALFWIFDLAGSREGLQWSFWITAAWGLALAFHALAYLVDGRDLEQRKTQQYLASERTRQSNDTS